MTLFSSSFLHESSSTSDENRGVRRRELFCKSAPFLVERLDLGLYPLGVHVKIQTGMLVLFFRFEI